ncbi:MAG: LLM class flavin-dependent oxidoreductase [Pseudomonadota bacterium]
MEIGLQLLSSSWGERQMTDSEVYQEDLELAIRADELGFDSIGMVEHHFEDYSFCPDNFVYLAHLAAKTNNAKLMTGAVIVPWNDPLRVAEKAALLDELCGGRLVLGLGRGLSRREYDQFGINMDESRSRFDEGTPMILDALETGVMQAHEGQYFTQPEAKIRPKPTRSFKGRVNQVAMSGDSVIEAATIGAKMMQFSYKPMEVHRQEIDTYAEEYRKLHAGAPPIPIFIDLTVCDTDAGRAEQHVTKYVGDYFLSVVHHYEMLGEHFAGAKGYEEYGEAAAAMREAGMDAVLEAYLASQIAGTPQQMLDKLHERRAVCGDFDMLFCFKFAGMARETAMRSLETFAKEVLPEMKNLDLPRTLAA